MRMVGYFLVTNLAMCSHASTSAGEPVHMNHVSSTFGVAFVMIAGAPLSWDAASISDTGSKPAAATVDPTAPNSF